MDPTASSLRPFDPALGATVLGWVISDDEARRWASLDARPNSTDVFARWHAEPDVRPYLLELRGSPVGYGEIWEDADENEAELARLIVDSGRRGQGFGRRLVHELLAEARRLGWADVWLRVEPDNQPALRCYAGAGFARATPAEEAAFNVGQPAAFVWMRAPAVPPDVSSGSA
jgi:ribosomal protein S18 acetylase RimI-like enzyme